MRLFTPLSLLLFFFTACQTDPAYFEHPEFEEVFTGREVSGCFVLFDEAAQEYHLFDSARCRQAFPPASTFKILNSLIILETGALKDTSEIIRWNGQKHQIQSWNRDHTMRSAFKASCLPCYQQLAHGVGVGSMRYYVNQSRYGNMVIDTNSISNFWLHRPSGITPFEQIDFLRRLYHDRLPFSKEHMAFVKDIMTMETMENNLLWKGKTGWTVIDRTNIGWLVGWVEQGNRVYYYATNIEAPDRASGFGEKRIAITKELLERLGVLREE